jgi:hypothetical protein
MPCLWRGKNCVELHLERWLLEWRWISWSAHKGVGDVIVVLPGVGDFDGATFHNLPLKPGVGLSLIRIYTSNARVLNYMQKLSLLLTNWSTILRVSTWEHRPLSSPALKRGGRNPASLKVSQERLQSRCTINRHVSILLHGISGASCGGNENRLHLSPRFH